MKIEKKHIIILAIVGAVVAYLLWKRGVFKGVTKVTGTGDDTDTGDADSPSSLDYILEHIAFTSAERAKINEVYNHAMSDKTYYQSLVAKANEKGYSFGQMVVLAAIWKLYTQNNSWVAGPNGETSYGYNLQHKVLRLNGQGLW